MLMTFSEYTNFSLSLKRIVNLPDTYEKLEMLQHKLSVYTGDKSSLVYRLAVHEYKKLNKIKIKLIKEKKKRIAKKWKDDSQFKSNKTVKLKITEAELNLLVSNLYKSYINTKKFKNLCKGLKVILPNFLIKYKRDKNIKYKKYYSIYIDVCEFLENNFSIKIIDFKDINHDPYKNINEAIKFLQNKIDRRNKGLPVSEEKINFSLNNFTMRLKELQLENE